MKKAIISVIAAAMVMPVMSDIRANALMSRLGDVNVDGYVDAADASLVLAEYAILATGGAPTLDTTAQKFADTNKDGKIDATDATNILEYYGRVSTGYSREFTHFLEIKSGTWRNVYKEQISKLTTPKENTYALFQLNSSTAPVLAVCNKGERYEGSMYAYINESSMLLRNFDGTLMPLRYEERSGKLLMEYKNYYSYGYYVKIFEDDYFDHIDGAITMETTSDITYWRMNDCHMPSEQLTKAEYDKFTADAIDYFNKNGKDVVFVSYNEVMKMLNK